MPDKRDVPLAALSLDLKNYRTVRQRDEVEAVRAMIAPRPDYFWALAESLLDDGFLPTENVIVLKGDKKELRVREGNRRVAALKLIHGVIPADDLTVPSAVAAKMSAVTPAWLKQTEKVPCVVYEADQAAVVSKIVRLIHGKGEKAGRDHWNSLARARENRDEANAVEPGLDLLEKYLESGRNLTGAQAARWAGDYPVTILDEALKKIAPRIGLKNAAAVAQAYPTLKYREAIERVAHDIGTCKVTFATLRGGDQLAGTYGFVATVPQDSKGGSGGSNASLTKGASGSKSNTSAKSTGITKPKAIAISDPKSVAKALRSFAPVGKNRDKLVALKEEAANLNITKTPLAFCFLLRSMFELSAKAYVEDHRATGGPLLTKVDPKGHAKDKPLGTLLREISKHVIGTGASKNKDLEKRLHGAGVDLASGNGVLSVTSMNHLIHNQSFTLSPHSISTMFGNVFPLLEAMNS